MAHRKKPVPTVVVGDIAELVEIFKYDVLPHATDATQFVVPSISGHLDPYTEEWSTVDGEPSRFNASGIVGTVSEDDMIFGLGGMVKVGDVKITYPYDAVSGIFDMEDVTQVSILTAGISGMYFINARMIDVVGNTPVFVDFALALDTGG